MVKWKIVILVLSYVLQTNADGNSTAREVPYSGNTSPSETSETSESGAPQIAVGTILGFLSVVALTLFIISIRRYMTNAEAERRDKLLLVADKDPQVTSSIDDHTRSLGESKDDLVPPQPLSVKPKPQGRVNPVCVDSRDNGVGSRRDVIQPQMSHFEPNSESSISVQNLLEYVKQKKANAPEHKLKAEYKSLPNDKLSPCTVGKKEVNAKKNRYSNIVTYDHSRVVLKKLNGVPDSDYINASYIDGYSKPNGYIAAQGPNKETIVDMWRMIWQERSQTIVMTTNLKEGFKRKCEQYWPSRGKAVKYGDIDVTNKKEITTKEYTIRTFHLSKKTGSKEVVRKVKQFHYTGWPDMDVPELAEPVLEYLDAINVYNPPDAGPIVVHCSAGVGRTGTFLAIDAMRKMAEAEGKVDILGYCKHMRARRPKMIQVQEQYVFIYETLLEALFCGTTAVASTDMERLWSELAKDSDLLTGQLQSLQAMYPDMSDDRCAGGKHSRNISKNRYPDRVPSDSSRPFLMSTGDHTGASNYVNATFCDGYAKQAIFLTTQVPLPNTVGDFWAMVYDYKCRTIVTLTHPSNTDKTCGLYWPDEGAITCGLFTIELLDINEFDFTTERKVKLSKSKGMGEIFTVTQIQYNEWPVNHELPNKAASFVNLLDRAERSRRNNGDQRIAVVCMSGVDRCGLFCAALSTIDQMKDDQQVDVFRAVKRLKKCRHDMVDSMEQYKFCYETARVYLQLFETYANFTP